MRGLSGDGGDVRLTIDDSIATVTLDRRDKHNALTRASLQQLEALAGGFRDMANVRAVIFRAEGRNFSVGMDLDEVGGAPEPTVRLRRTARLGARAVRAIREIDQPTICVLQGVATGGATCIATACDFRIAGDGARLGYGEVKLGINLMWNALPLAVELVGPSRAKQMIMSGDLFDAATLADWGFIDAVVADAEREATALAWAERYAALPPVAVQMIKRSVNAIAGALGAAVVHADADQWLLATRTDDFAEAMDAFRGKRSGVFTGK